MKLKKGDNVIMLSGKDRGKTGTVQRTDPRSGRIIVGGLNLVKRHQRARKQGQKGQIVSIERWVSASSAAYVSKESGKATRLGWQLNPDGSKVRIDTKSKIPVQ
jgi:large subunit ribosomal protein L24